MKKVLLITLDFPPKLGGVGQYLLGIAKYFDKNICVIAPPMENDSEFDAKQNFKIYRKSLLFRFFWPRHLEAVFETKKFYDKEEAEILAVNDVLPLGYAALVLKWIFKTPYFIFLHGLDFNLAKRNFWKRFWLKRILKSAEFVVCNSQYLKGEVKKLNSRIETMVVFPSPQIPPLRVRGGEGGLSNKKGKIIFSFGRLIKRKGFDQLILAFKKMNVDAFLIIAGAGQEEKYLKELARGNKRIIFVGEINKKQKWAFYNLCDIFALPVREINGDIEGFGIVYLEAALFGKPSIAGRVGGVSEAVVDGQTGILVDGENVDEISDAIIKLLKDDNLRKEMGERARRRILEEFTIEKQVVKIAQRVSF